jgi:signal recognition particle subunit SRP54
MGTGEKYNALEPFHPDRIASRILGMGDVMSLIEQAENALEEEEVLRLEEKMRKNKYDLEDFLTQMKQINKLGGLSKIIDMIPGISAADKKNLDLEQGRKDLARMEAVILSMTVKERRNPQILNASRRKRIAAGSGQTVQTVNQVMKKYEEMKKMAKIMTNPNSKKARAMMRNMGF